MIKEIKTRLGVKHIHMIPWKSGMIPKAVYKYRDWKNNYHRKMLLHQEIYISSPRNFNDPFDCRIPIAYHLLQNNKKLANNYFTQVVVRHFPELSKAERVKKVNRLLDEGQLNSDEFIKSENQKWFDKLHSTLGVFSVTTVNDNILMWAHYSNNHQGFCVGFDSAKLFGYIGSASEINYVEEFPTILPTEDFAIQQILQTNTKASYWDYEIEYRLTKHNYSNKSIKIPKEVITEIILGFKMSDSDKKDILKIISIELPHVKVFKTKPKELDFELELIEIT